jgi:hypothetical protein
MTLNTKATVWKEENEWRLTWRNNETKSQIQRIAITDKSILAVYVGQSTSKSVRDDIIFETKHQFPSAKIFEAQKKGGGAFALSFKQV